MSLLVKASKTIFKKNVEQAAETVEFARAMRNLKKKNKFEQALLIN